MTTAPQLRLSPLLALRRPCAVSPVRATIVPAGASAAVVPTTPTAGGLCRPWARVSLLRFVTGILGALAVLSAFLVAVHR